MKFKCEELFLLIVIAMNVIQLEASPPFGDLLNNPKFNPILSIKFTIKDPYAICEASGLLPITYTIKVLSRNEQYFISNNIVNMEHGHSKYFLVCEGKSVLGNNTWTKTIILYNGLRNKFVRLINGNTSNEGLIEFFYSGKWRHPCDDNFMNDEQGRINGDVICRELGFSGVHVMKSDGTFGGNRPFYMDDVYCDGNETSLADCRSSIGPNAHDCRSNEYNAGVVCRQNKFVRLINGNEPNEGLIQFYYSGNWRFACDDDFMNDEQGKINGDVICRELGFPGVDIMKSDGTFGRNKYFYMDNVKCMGNETSLSKCSSSIGPNAHDCRPDENPAGIICRNVKQNEKIHILDRTDSVIEFNSSVTTDFNGYQKVALKCIFEMNSKTFLTFEIWRMQGSNNPMIQMYDINSTLNVIKATNESIIISYTHTYVPSEPDTNDTFVCLVKDVGTLFTGRKELFIEYSYALKQITLDLIYPRGNISIFNTSTNATENESRIASHVLCSVNFDSSNASFTWSYTATNGTNSFEGRILDLNGIEQRLPICCQVTLGSNNISKCMTLQEQPITPVLRTSTLCQMGRIDVKCPPSTDFIVSAIYAGYFQTCSPRNIQPCQLPMFTKFIKEERCKEENKCRITNQLFKKSYIKHILKNLGGNCSKGTIPFMKMDYYCLEKIPTSISV